AASRAGTTHVRVTAWQQRWVDRFAEALGQAVAGGELPRDTDIDQLDFEITAMLVRANFSWVVTGETRVLEQARIGIRHVLERVAGHAGREGRSTEKPAARGRSRARA